jgi:myosin-crossreactive antigen
MIITNGKIGVERKYKMTFSTCREKSDLLGGRIGSMAAAAFMIRYGAFCGENIYILETKSVIGGSLDGAGNPTDTLRSRYCCIG